MLQSPEGNCGKHQIHGTMAVKKGRAWNEGHVRVHWIVIPSTKKDFIWVETEINLFFSGMCASWMHLSGHRKFPELHAFHSIPATYTSLGLGRWSTSPRGVERKQEGWEEEESPAAGAACLTASSQSYAKLQHFSRHISI